MSGWMQALTGELALLMRILRILRNWSKTVLSRRTGIQRSSLTGYEAGRHRPEPPTMARILAAGDYPEDLPDRILPWLREIEREAEREPEDPAEAGQVKALASRLGEIVAAVSRGVLPGLLGRLRAPDRAASPAATLEAAEAAERYCAFLVGREPAARRLLVEVLPELQTAPVCHRLCEASVAAAADDPADALDRAELAVRVARLVPGTALRARREGRATAFRANARRAAGDLGGADRDCTEAWRLWNQEAPAAAAGEEPGGSPEAELAEDTRLLDLEASLRRAQRRWGEAFALLDRALAQHPDGEAAARILLNKAFTHEQKGDAEDAIATLKQAHQKAAGSRDLRLHFGIRFNLAATLIHFDRHAEAEELVPAVRDLAARLETAIDGIRVRWLEGKIHAGLGRPGEAIAALAEVQAAFIARRMAYDTALVTLELALLLAERGETRRVKALVEAAAPVFKAQKIHREALACYRLLQEAAEREAVTAALARRLLERLAGSA